MSQYTYLLIQYPLNIAVVVTSVSLDLLLFVNVHQFEDFDIDLGVGLAIKYTLGCIHTSCHNVTNGKNEQNIDFVIE